MHKFLFLPGVVLLSLLTACTGTSMNRSEPETLAVPLEATRYNAGEIGRAVFVAQGNQTAVHVVVSDVPLGTTRPIHLHTYIYKGACQAENSQLAYDLTDRVLAESIREPGAIAAINGPVSISAVAPVELAKLRETPHSIHVRTAPADGNQRIFCGNIG